MRGAAEGADGAARSADTRAGGAGGANGAAGGAPGGGAAFGAPSGDDGSASPSFYSPSPRFVRTTSLRRLLYNHLFHLVATFLRWLRLGPPLAQYAFALWDVFSLVAVDVLRFSAGSWVAVGVDKCARPTDPLVLYELEACFACRRVRETLCVLNLDYYVLPAPRESFSSAASSDPESNRFRAFQLGATDYSFPLLLDLGALKMVHGAENIMSYLWRMFGGRASAPLAYQIAQWPPLQHFSLHACLLLRPCAEMGIIRLPARAVQLPMHLWGLESSPFVRRVRERLCSLQLRYVMHVLPWGADEKRAEFARMFPASCEKLPAWGGLLRLPMFEDPNTGVRMFDSAEIVKYLERSYQLVDAVADGGEAGGGDADGFQSGGDGSAAAAAAVSGGFVSPRFAAPSDAHFSGLPGTAAANISGARASLAWTPPSWRDLGALDGRSAL